MQYEQNSDKAPITPMQMSQPLTTNQDYRPSSSIRRTRMIVLILLAIKMIFALFNFIQRIVDLAKYYNVSTESRDRALASSYIGNIVLGALTIIFLIIFIFVVVKYNRIGILIFAWLGFLELICMVIILVLAIIAIVAFSAELHNAGAGIISSVIILVIAVIASILTILTVIFSFKLAKLLKLQEAYQFV